MFSKKIVGHKHDFQTLVNISSVHVIQLIELMKETSLLRIIPKTKVPVVSV